MALFNFLLKKLWQLLSQIGRCFTATLSIAIANSEQMEARMVINVCREDMPILVDLSSPCSLIPGSIRVSKLMHHIT